MIIIITGTPGTGKTTIAPLLADKLDCKLVDVNHLVEEKHLYTGLDPEKGYKVVDIDALVEELHKQVNIDDNPNNIDDSNSDHSNIIIEGHLSHYYPESDFVIVLRTNPDTLKSRLQNRDWKDVKILENLEAEALDVCTWESYQVHGNKVHEIDTSHINPENAVSVILNILCGKKSYPPGNIDFSDYFG